MRKDRVVIVHLRRPGTKPSEMRSDPFWESEVLVLPGVTPVT
jgi:hypothetical protein